MCMGYAKDIKAWVCPQEIGRREHSLERWGEMIREVAEALKQPASSEPEASKVWPWPGSDALKFDVAA